MNPKSRVYYEPRGPKMIKKDGANESQIEGFLWAKWPNKVVEKSDFWSFSPPNPIGIWGQTLFWTPQKSVRPQIPMGLDQHIVQSRRIPRALDKMGAPLV